MRVVFLNGPPGSGKDEAGKHFYTRHGARLYKMSGSMKAALTALFGLRHDEAAFVEAHKEQPMNMLFHWSWRDVQISLSEDWCKPRFGTDFFGQLAVHKLLEPTSAPFTAITDAGFYHEVVPILQAFGPSNCLLIRLRREGCTYDSDSRSYLVLDDYGVKTVDLDNKLPLLPTPDMPVTYGMQLTKIMKEWLG